MPKKLVIVESPAKAKTIAGYLGPDFVVEVIDTGAMVDPRSVPRVDLPRYVSERRKGGLGVHLMEKIMDSVTFRRTARRNVCLLAKHKDPDGGRK